MQSGSDLPYFNKEENLSDVLHILGNDDLIRNLLNEKDHQ